MAVKIRAVAVGVFRFALVCLLAVVFLIGAALAGAFLFGWLQREAWNRPLYLVASLMCGLIALLFFAAFHLRRESHDMSFSQRDQFLAKAKAVLQEMGYVLTVHKGDALLFHPRFHSYLFGGAIQISLLNQDAKLTGPKVSLEVFRRCFRLFNHVQRVQIYLRDQKKVTDNVLKRAELRLKLTPAQLEPVRKHVIDLLAKDAAVACELNLIVTSDSGIRENLLEGQIHEWLEQQGIACAIHKELVQFVEVTCDEPEPETVTS